MPDLPERFLEALVERFGRAQEIEGLFLMGSAGLRELIWDGDVLLSDVEFGVVVKYLTPTLRRQVRSIAAELQEVWGYELEPALVTRRRLTKGSPKNISFRQHRPNQLMYDVQHAARWLIEPAVSIEQPSWEPDLLPSWEAIRLILNRFGEWAGVLAKVGGTQKLDALRCRDKVLVAIADARIMRAGQYVPGYSRRRAVFKDIAKLECGDRWIEAAYAARVRGIVATLDVAASEVIALGVVVLGQLMEQSPHSDPNLLSWVCADRSRAPVRHQAPIKSFDWWFECLLTLPSALRHRQCRELLVRAWRLRVPPFVLGYHYLLQVFVKLSNSTFETFPHTEIEEAHEIWKKLCK